MKEIYLAGGCFWGTEKYLSLINGIISTEVGYANGNVKNSTYEQVCSGSGHTGANKREDAIVKNSSGKKIKYKINRKPSQVKKLSASGQYAAKKTEHKKSSVRAKVEHVFAVIKKLFWYRKTLYRGLRKQTAKLNMMFALANLYLADKKFLTA